MLNKSTYSKHKIPVERILIIFKKLYDKEQIDIKDIASKFGVSTRTIYRDIKIINKIIPIENDQKGGYFLVQSDKGQK